MSITPKSTYYDVLDVDKNASQPQIKQAFRRLAKQYHPDTNPKDGKGAAKKLREVIAAYRVLSNERERARYDVLMRSTPIFEEEARRSEARSPPSRRLPARAVRPRTTVADRDGPERRRPV